MLARWLRWLVVLETGCYLALAAWLRWRGLLSTSGCLLFILGAPLLARALWLGGLMALSKQTRRGSPPPALPALTWARMFAREWLALIRVFGLVMPFEARWMGADRLNAADGRTPVLLVHGYRCNRGVWLWMREALESRGHIVATLNLEPPLADIDIFARALHTRIDEVLAATGASQVALIGHSMGGLVAEAYLRQHGGERVTKLITLGSPFGGSALARFGQGRCAKQMQPGNPWLLALNAAPAPLGVETTNLYSLHDALVAPPDALQAGAHHIGFAGIGHLEMSWSVPVLARVCDVLERDWITRR
ncbi:MAG: hypothetical protein RIR70_1747, partial [Pseudomonadota bacterium]